jgi:hypothetical protein
MPSDKPTLIQGVFDKLSKLSEGQTYTLTDDEAKQKEAAAAAAQKASDEVNKTLPNIERVDANIEAAK